MMCLSHTVIIYISMQSYPTGLYAYDKHRIAAMWDLYQYPTNINDTFWCDTTMIQWYGLQIQSDKLVSVPEYE